MSNLLLRRRMMMQAGGSPTPSIPEGALPFPFSVSASKKVYFSKGNLQWSATGGGTTPTTHATADGGVGEGTWRFAEEQWHYVGDNNYGNVYNDNNVKSSNALIDQNYDGWIDLFSWGTSGYHNAADEWNIYYNPYDYIKGNNGQASGWKNAYGYAPSTNMTDISLVGTSANYDWGVYNAIVGGGNQTGLWRLLTYDEAQYILYTRANASDKILVSTVNGVKGVILLPDDFITPAGYTFNTGIPTSVNWSNNVFTLLQWQELELNGAVFFPALGNRNVKTVSYHTTSQYQFYYSTSTRSGSNGHKYFGFRQVSYGYGKDSDNYLGEAVRLVKDVI